METFEAHQVAFVSVTQHFNSGTSMGRLVLNVLLSFAQFERELIAERTRDKVAAARRKGKWSGGLPCLGYDVDALTRKLAVNEEEAVRVRAIFALYLEYRGLLPLVEELERRGWCNKQSVTRKGSVRGGQPFTKGSLYALLTNVTYIGQVRYKREVHQGEQPAIVDAAVRQEVQSLLTQNGLARAVAVRSRSGALLQGLLRCRPCGCAMTPSHVARGNRRYRYYVCSAAQKKGRQTCPSRSLPAAAIERFVLEQIAPHTGDGSHGSAPWLGLAPHEQARRLREVVARIDYDGTCNQVAITLRPTAPAVLAGTSSSDSAEEMP
jgi:site-specific DNA recombinase